MNNLTIRRKVFSKIEEGLTLYTQIEIDLEMIEYFCQKYNQQDTAVFLGKIMFLGDENYVILIIRNGNAITIEFRRCGQNCDKIALNVEKVEKYPCLF